jgi:ribosomal protein L11 methyltransferase
VTARTSQPETDWIEVTVRVWPPDVEAVADVLRELAPDGVSIEPAIRTLDTDNFAFEYLDAPSLLRACVRAPLAEPVRRALRRRLGALEVSAPVGRLRYAPLAQHAWADEWKRFFHTLRVGRLVVRPSWEHEPLQAGELLIDLDPGAAFGTGQHETTRLCLGALDAHLAPGTQVIDLGTGSGILAIAAARLGAASVRAIDVDAEAVEVARENVARNGVSGVVTPAAGSLGATWPWSEAAAASADCVVANISSAAVVALLPACVEALRPGGLWIGSGFLVAAAPGVEAAAHAAGLRTLGTTTEGEWCCLVATRSGAAPSETRGAT